MTVTEYFDALHDLIVERVNWEIAARRRAEGEAEFWQKKYLHLALETSKRNGSKHH